MPKTKAANSGNITTDMPGSTAVRGNRPRAANAADSPEKQPPNAGDGSRRRGAPARGSKLAASDAELALTRRARGDAIADRAAPPANGAAEQKSVPGALGEANFWLTGPPQKLLSASLLGR